MPNAKTASTENLADREIVITRVFDAPREMAWDAWTDPKQVVRWWGPRGFTTTIHEMDVRPGGVWRQTMHGPDGTDYPGQMVFVEVVITPSTKLMTLFNRRRIEHGVRKNSSSPPWASPA